MTIEELKALLNNGIVQDNVEAADTSRTHVDYCYELIRKLSKSQPAILDLVDAIIRHCETYTLAEAALKEQGIDSDAAAYLAYELQEKLDKEDAI